MDWEVCKKEHISKVEPDQDKINSILKMTKVRHRVLNYIKQDSETTSIICENYYEIMKELLIAIMIKDGLKSKNHECLVSYFKRKYPNYEFEISVIHYLKKIRNKISYDGFFIEEDYLEKNKLEFEHIINLLIDKILE